MWRSFGLVNPRAFCPELTRSLGTPSFVFARSFGVDAEICSEMIRVGIRRTTTNRPKRCHRPIFSACSPNADLVLRIYVSGRRASSDVSTTCERAGKTRRIFAGKTSEDKAGSRCDFGANVAARLRDRIVLYGALARARQVSFVSNVPRG